MTVEKSTTAVGRTWRGSSSKKGGSEKKRRSKRERQRLGGWGGARRLEGGLVVERSLSKNPKGKKKKKWGKHLRSQNSLCKTKSSKKGFVNLGGTTDRNKPLSHDHIPREETGFWKKG